jgi:hypothetical protein
VVNFLFMRNSPSESGLCRARLFPTSYGPGTVASNPGAARQANLLQVVSAVCAAAAATVITGGVIDTASAAAAICTCRIVGTTCLACFDPDVVGTAGLAHMVGHVIGAATLADMARRIVATAALVDFAGNIIGAVTGHGAGRTNERGGSDGGHQAGFQDQVHRVSPWGKVVRDADMETTIVSRSYSGGAELFCRLFPTT